MTIEQRNIVDRDTWLQWRRNDVTASTVGALFGAHPYCTALKLYAQARGVEFDEQQESKTLRRGRWLEPAVARAVSELRPDWEIEAPNVYLRDPELRLGATPDFYIRGDPRGLGILQAKSVAPSIFHREWLGGQEPPLWISLQCLCEMMLADAAFGAVAMLLVDPHQMDCHICEVPRNPTAEAKIVAAVRDFWSKVAAGEEPEPDYGRDADVIRALTPHEMPGKSIDLAGNNVVPELLAQRAGLKARITADESRCEEIENELKFILRDAEFATGLDQWRITFKSGERAGYTVKPKVMRVLRIRDMREKQT